MLGKEEKGIYEGGIKFEKYGYLGSAKNNGPTQYGKLKFIFKKSSLMNRTTMTLGDSLIFPQQPSRITDPKVESIPFVINHWPYIAKLILVLNYSGTITPQMDPADVINKIESDYKRRRSKELPLEFFELQFHGLLTKKDVQECILPANTKDVIKDAIKEQNIKVTET